MPLFPVPASPPPHFVSPPLTQRAQSMASNHKLSALLKGRVLDSAQAQPDRVLLLFADGSRLQIKTAAPVARESIVLPTTPVRAVRQNDESITLDFEPAAVPAAPEKIPETPEENPQQKPAPEPPTALSFRTLEATASVMLRDKDGVLEYAD